MRGVVDPHLVHEEVDEGADVGRVQFEEVQGRGLVDANLLEGV